MIFVSTCAQESLGHARPLDPGRDMRAIADLIEVAFRGELDRAASSLVADMRQLAALGPLLTIVDRITPFPSGYVWEEDGRVVGNVTITVDDRARGLWFVSNVAVHPRYQRRGIGRQLMEASLAGVRRQGGRMVLLQVRADNEAAQGLYRRLGFERFDTIVELLRPGSLIAPGPSQLGLHRLTSQDWPALYDLALASTPAEVQRVRPVRPVAFRPGLGRRLREWLDAFFVGRQTLRWGLAERGSLVAAVSTLVYRYGGPARLDLTVRPAARGPLEGPLADAGLASLEDWRPSAVAANVSTGHPEALRALQERHFASVRSLDQLALAL